MLGGRGGGGGEGNIAMDKHPIHSRSRLRKLETDTLARKKSKKTFNLSP